DHHQALHLLRAFDPRALVTGQVQLGRLSRPVPVPVLRGFMGNPGLAQPGDGRPPVRPPDSLDLHEPFRREGRVQRGFDQLTRSPVEEVYAARGHYRATSVLVELSAMNRSSAPGSSFILSQPYR